MMIKILALLLLNSILIATLFAQIAEGSIYLLHHYYYGNLLTEEQQLNNKKRVFALLAIWIGTYVALTLIA